MIELRLFGSVDLVPDGTGDGRAILRQPKRLALLAYLAAAEAGHFARRDELLATFWPDHDEPRARHALRQSLHVLRGALGHDVFQRRADDEIAVCPTVLSCDATRFTRLCADGEHEAALALYRGDLLAAFHVDGLPAFERWLDAERMRLRHRASHAARQLAESARQAGDHDAATRWAHRRMELAPDDEGAVRDMLHIHAGAGERAAGLRAYGEFARRLSEDLDLEPAPATRLAADELRRSPAASAVPRAEAAPRAPVETETPPTLPVTENVARARPRWRIAVGAAACAALLAAAWLATRAAADAPYSTRPAVATRLFDEGMVALERSDYPAAERLLTAAVREDSTFALAYLFRGAAVHRATSDAIAYRDMERAMRLAPMQSDRDRLVVMAWATSAFDDPRRRAYAETLAIRYPDYVQGQYFVAESRLNDGEPALAVAPLRRAIALDSALRRREGHATCLGCAPYALLGAAYAAVDSLARSEEVARAWTVAEPGSTEAWGALSYVLATEERYEEALAARQRADDVRPGGADGNARGEILLRAGDFRTLDHMLEARLAGGTSSDRADARWLRWIALREQGRVGEALREAERMGAIARTSPAGDATLAALAHAQSLHEAGHWRESARVWDSLAAKPLPEYAPSRAARARVGDLAHAGDALAAAGDTGALRMLVDSVEADGRRSGFGRDVKLHHHLRGLLLVSRDRPTEACDELRRALHTALVTYVRNNLAIGRACIAAHRAGDALAPLRQVLHGAIGASGTWGTRTEAHELLGQLFDARGERDSAVAHYRRAIDAWARGDADFQRRRGVMLARVAVLAPATR